MSNNNTSNIPKTGKFEEGQQGKERAGYGNHLIKSLSERPGPQFANGFGKRQLELMMRIKEPATLKVEPAGFAKNPIILGWCDTSAGHLSNIAQKALKENGHIPKIRLNQICEAASIFTKCVAHKHTRKKTAE